MPSPRNMEGKEGLGGEREDEEDRMDPSPSTPPQFPETHPSSTFQSEVNLPVVSVIEFLHLSLVIEPQISALYVAAQTALPRLRKPLPQPILTALSWVQKVHRAGDGEREEIFSITDGDDGYE